MLSTHAAAMFPSAVSSRSAGRGFPQPRAWQQVPVSTRRIVTLLAQAAPATAPVPNQAAPATRPLELHMGETTVCIPFSRDSALELQGAFSALLQAFAAKAKAERPRRWESMDFKLQASAGAAQASGPDAFEVFCNPNAYDNHINAKVLITLRHQGLKLTTEAKLHPIKADVDTYLQQ